jgi:hypothetical protein
VADAFEEWASQKREAPSLEPQDEPGFLSKALGVGLEVAAPIGWALDVLGRPVRTFLGTGDIERAFDSITDPEQALYGRDLLDKIGIGTFGYADGKFDWGDIPDFILETGVEIATDPISYTGIGAVTKLGAKTTTIGRSALRALQGSADDVVKELAEASGRASARAAALGKAGDYSLEVADDVARWINGQHAAEGIATRVKTLDDLMPNWADTETLIKNYPDMLDAGELEKLAKAKLDVKAGLQEHLSHFGLGKTWAEQMKRGERALIGIGPNPFGRAAETPIFGTGTDVGQRLVQWMDDTTGVIDAAMTATPYGRWVSNAATKTKEVLFNPRADTSFEQMQGAAKGMSRPEYAKLQQEVLDFHKDVMDSGLDPVKKHIIDVASSGSKDRTLHDKAIDAIQTWALDNKMDAGKLSLDAERLAKRFNSINASHLRWMMENDPEIAALGDLQRGIMDEYKGLLNTDNLRKLEANQAELNYNRELEALNKAQGNIVQSQNDIISAKRNAYEKAKQEAASINQGKAIRRQVAKKLKDAGVDEARAQRILHGMDNVAGQYGVEAKDFPDNWYVKVGSTLQTDEMLKFEKADAAASRAAGPSVETLLKGVTGDEKQALLKKFGATEGQTVKELTAKGAPQEMVDRAMRAEIQIEQALNARTTTSEPILSAVDDLNAQLRSLNEPQRKAAKEWLHSTASDVAENELLPHHVSARELGNLFGVNVRFKKGLKDKARALGAYSGRDIFIDSGLDSFKTFEVVGHEVLHDIMSSAIGRRKILKGINESLPTGLKEKYSKQYSGLSTYEGASRELKLAEEALAFAAGRNFTDPKWLEKIVKTSNDPAFVQRIMSGVDAFLERLKSIYQSLSGTGDDANTSALQALRKQARDILEARRHAQLSIEKRHGGGAFAADKTRRTAAELRAYDGSRFAFSAKEIADAENADRMRLSVDEFLNSPPKYEVGAFGSGSEAKLMAERAWESDDPIIAKMQRQIDAIQNGTRPKIRGVANPVKEVFLDDKLSANPISSMGVKDPYLMSLQEFKDEVVKLGKGVQPDLESIEAAHRRSIRLAIIEGFHVPAKAFEAHALTNKAYAIDGVVQRANLSRLSRASELLSGNDFKELLKVEREAARELVKKRGKVADQAARDAIEALAKRYETEVVDKLPTYAKIMFTADAAETAAKDTAYLKGTSGHQATLGRKFLDTGGLPLSPSQINELLINEPERIHRMISLGGIAPEGTPGFFKTLLAAYRPDDSTYKAIAKIMAKGKKVTEEHLAAARNLSTEERLKYFKQSFATIMEERPEVLLATSLESTARAIDSMNFRKGMRNLFAKPLGQAVENEASKKMLEDIAKAQKLVDSGMADPKAKQWLETLKDQYAHSGGDAVDKGWVRAAGLGKELEGMQVKAEVYKQAVQYLNGQTLARNVKNLSPLLTAMVKDWKMLQLSAPGSVIRNLIGDVALLLQNNAIAPSAVMDIGRMQRLVTSGGDLTKLAAIGDWKLGGRTYTSEQLYKAAVTRGIFDLSDVSQEMADSLAGKMARGPLGKIKGKAKDLSAAVNNYQRNSTRMLGFYSRLKAGDLIDDAAAKVNMALYDYSRVSPAVEFARTTGIIPFATWISKNVPAQLELMLTKPGQFAALVHAKNSIEQGVPGVTEQQMPAYIKDKFNITFGRDENGKLLLTTLSNVIPAADLWENPLRMLFNSLGPAAKIPMEQMMNRNSFTQQDIQKLDKLGFWQMAETDAIGPTDIKVPVRVGHIIRNTIGRPLTLSESVGDVMTGSVNPKTGKPYGWLEAPGTMSWVTGIPLKRVDEMAVLIDEYAEMERDVREMKSSASRYGRRGYSQEEQRLLQMAHEMEEKMAGGKWRDAKRLLRQQQRDRRRETIRRQSGYGIQ